MYACRLKELEDQYAKEKAATERQFEKQRQVCDYFLLRINTSPTNPTPTGGEPAV